MDLTEYFTGFTPKPIGKKSLYAVFVPIISVGGIPSLLYQVRSRSLRRQPSEICFPGGGMEADETPVQAALRELQEEMGVTPSVVYGQTNFLVQRTGNIIYPVLGELDEKAEFYLSPDEVSEIFTVPISHLKEQKEEYSVRITPQAEFSKEVLGLSQEYEFRQGKETFGVYRYENRIIWGITGSITREILSIM